MNELNEVEVNNEVETTQEVIAEVVTNDEVTNEVTAEKYQLTGIDTIDLLIVKYNTIKQQQEMYKDMIGMEIVCDSLQLSIDVLTKTIDTELNKLGTLKASKINQLSIDAVTYLNTLLDGDDDLKDKLTLLFAIDNKIDGIIMKLNLSGQFVLAGKTVKTATGKSSTQLNYTERYQLTELNKYNVHKTNRDGSVIRAGYVYVGDNNRIIWDSVNGQQYTSPTKFWTEIAGQNAGIHSLNHKCFTLIGAIELETITDDDGNIIKTGFNELWDKLTK